MLDHPFGHEAQLSSCMNLPAAQPPQNVAPFSELVPLPQGTHAVLFDSSANVLAAHSLHLLAASFPTSLEYLPGGHALQPSETPVADE